jgi:glycerate dehydrogenase
MHIVVLDGYTLNPGDLSWGELESLGSCKVYDRTAPAELIDRAAAAEILLTNKTVLRREHMGQMQGLKYIGVLATGTDIVDLAAAREREIPVTNVPAYGTRSVAQATMALLLELTQRTGYYAETVRKGRWTRSQDWCYWDGSLVELEGLTIGIIGFGRIGRAVGELAAAFGMKVLAYTPGQKAIPSFASLVSLETLFRDSDVVSLHCPLTPQTRALVNAERLDWMKPTAFLLNTSRGLLIEEAALAQALNAGKIAGAGLDVLSTEPPACTNPLLTANNCIITPHQAWATRAARSRLMKIAVENVRAFLDGKAQNVVN